METPTSADMDVCEGVAGVGEHLPLVNKSSEHAKIHYRLRVIFGPARFLDCIQCGGSAWEWAWQHGQNPRDTASYEPMCKSCHRLYDHTPEWGAAIGRSQIGNTRSAGHVNNFLGRRHG